MPADFADPRNALPLAWDEALAAAELFENLFNAHDVDGILACFPERFVVCFADFPEMNTRPELAAWLRARFRRQKNYRIKKTLRTVSGNVLGTTWEASWIDAVTGARMCGKGAEFCGLVDGKLADWHASFNVWEKGGGPVSQIV